MLPSSLETSVRCKRVSSTNLNCIFIHNNLSNVLGNLFYASGTQFGLRCEAAFALLSMC